MTLNFPNVLVLIRIALVPIVVILLLLPSVTTVEQLSYWNGNLTIYVTDIIAGVLFLIASITDFVDGWWARKFNQVSTFGKLFDPLADKILVNTTLILFSARGILPIVFTIIFICRDILVDGLRMMLASSNVVLAADKWGKLKTIFQMVGLTILYFAHQDGVMLFSTFDWTSTIEVVLIIPMMIALLFSIISGFNYFINGFKKLNTQEQNDQ